MLASQIPLKPADRKPWSHSPWGAKAMTKKKEVTPPKALEYDTTCARCGWVFESRVRTELSEVQKKVGHLLQAGIEHWSIFTQEIAASPYSTVHVKLTQSLLTDVAVAQYELLMFNRHLLYPVVTVTAGNQCLWFNTSNGNLRCGYLSTGGNIWRMCFSDIFTSWEMKGAFCMTHIHVFHLWYF